MSHRMTAAAVGLLIAASVAAAPVAAASAAAASPTPQRQAASGPLTNLAHLDFLTTTVTPPPQPGHTTYQLGSEPTVGVLWVYANYLAPGAYQVTGGGAYDAANNTYGQGSYDAGLHGFRCSSPRGWCWRPVRARPKPSRTGRTDSAGSATR